MNTIHAESLTKVLLMQPSDAVLCFYPIVAFDHIGKMLAERNKRRIGNFQPHGTGKSHAEQFVLMQVGEKRRSGF